MSEFTELLDRPEPTIAVSVADSVSGEVMEQFRAIKPVVEFRGDLAEDPDPEVIRDQIQTFAEIPLLFTVQMEAEGGRWSDTNARRTHLFAEIIPVSDAIDTGNPRYMPSELIETAQTLGKTVIVSKHFTDGTPEISELQDFTDEAFDEHSADYVMVAAKINNPQDLAALIEFKLLNPLKNLITVGMGDEGIISRLLLPILGSKLGYAYVAGQKPTAPGQYNHLQMHNNFVDLSPGYRALYGENPPYFGQPPN